jgi:tripartite-type tricarboxylate transporter receptor subunit TctC
MQEGKAQKRCRFSRRRTNKPIFYKYGQAMENTLYFNRRRDLLIAGAFLSTGATAQVKDAGKWPERPLKCVVGFPSGSSPDMLARTLAEPLSKLLKQPVIVENKPGASGNIGADVVAKSTDGHTFGIVANGPLTSSRFLYDKLPYDPSKDFAPISLVGTSPLILVVAKDWVSGGSEDVIKKLKLEGEKVSYGSVGAGSGSHLGMELIKEKLGLKAVHVPFPGGSQVISAIVGGHVQIGLLPISTAMPLIQSGKLYPVAVTSSIRSPLAPLVPTLHQLGASNLNVEVWNAIVTPTGFPSNNQSTLTLAVSEVLAARETRVKLLLQGWKDVEAGQLALTKRIQRDTVLYRDLILSRGIKL